MDYYLSFKATGKFERTSFEDPPELPFEAEGDFEVCGRGEVPHARIDEVKGELAQAYLLGGDAGSVIAGARFVEGDCIPAGFFEGGQLDSLSVSIGEEQAEE
jgi:hypothetical protein